LDNKNSLESKGGNMKPAYVLAGIIFILIFALINYYIGLQGWRYLGAYLSFINKKGYWIVFWAISLSYFVARFAKNILPKSFINLFSIIGSYWISAMFYFILILVIMGIITLLNNWLNFIPQNIKVGSTFSFIGGLTILILVIGLLVYGTWNANRTKIISYDIEIKKKTPELQELHAVMVADIHLGDIVDNKRLVKLVDSINRLQPDIIFLPGDIVDDYISPFIEQKMEDTFLKLQAKYGVYAVLGNHEYIGGEVEDIIYHLNRSGIQVLRDEYTIIANSFYVVGRDDLISKRLGGKERANLSELLEGIDKSLPIIFLDHQPQKLTEPHIEGVDLQLSGHTHKGQFFPNNLITGKIFEIDWGYLKKDDYQIIVTSGYGTWGPPIKIGNSSEIIDIKITFSDKSE